ncbi:TPA_asm: hypothetical protein G2922_24670, partial [Salmonella enterica subsp. enterica serovar Typhimurium]|nr:hypothetical protein [Salmonella enterica subsp. enterica serovar Typhimurium]
KTLSISWSHYLGEFNHSTPFTSHFIYITDYHKDNTWMISLSQEDFNTTKILTSLSLGKVRTSS